MKKHYFLGYAASFKHPFLHIFATGSSSDSEKLTNYLASRYSGEAILTKNGRSALSIALNTYFNKNDRILVNGFTCYAVVEAVKAAEMKPVYADIDLRTLNFTAKTLEDAFNRDKNIRGIIIQNTLGNPVEIDKILKFAKKHDLLVIEDLAHSAGVHYPDNREAGTIGSATILSFGKEKSIDTISGGALILRDFEHINGQKYNIPKNAKKLWTYELRPKKRPRHIDNYRARWYPFHASVCCKLSYLHLNGVFMRILLTLKLVEKSADNKLDLKRRPADFEAKSALKQLKTLEKAPKTPLREFYLLNNRDEVLGKLQKNGYFFDGFWYETPIAPKRYYKKSGYVAKNCPNAVLVSEKIINFPTYYKKKDLDSAYKILKNYGDFYNGEKNV